jgi:hypothetical protein
MDYDERLRPTRSKFATERDKGCIGLLLDKYPDRADDIRAIVDASHDIGALAAARILEDEGLIPIADQAIRRHRRKVCTCKTR